MTPIGEQMKHRLSRLYAPLFTASALLLALALRLKGIEFASSTPRGRPDEEIFVTVALNYFAGLPPFSHLPEGWPEGFFFIIHLLERLEGFVLSSWTHVEVNLGCLFAERPLALLLAGRGFSAVMGVAACALTGLSARRLVPTEMRAAAPGLGALVLGCNYVAGRDGHFGVSDATLCALIALAVYLLIRALQESPRLWLVACAVAGAAFGIKYSAAGLIAPCATAGFFLVLRERKQGIEKLARSGITALILGPASALVGLFLLSPRSVLHPSELRASLLSHGFRYDTSGHSFEPFDVDAHTPAGWIFHSTVTLPLAFGLIGLALALFGLWLAFRRDREIGITLAVTVLAFFCEVAASRLLFVRYGSPMLPALAIGLTLSLATVWSRALQGGPSAASPALSEAGASPAIARSRVVACVGALALCLLALVPPAVRLVRFDHLLSQDDTRDVAAAWLLAQGPTASVSSDGWIAEQVQAVEPGVLDACNRSLPTSLQAAVPKLSSDTRDWRGMVASGRQGWSRLANESQMSKYATPSRFVAQARAVLPCKRLGRQGSARTLDPRCFRDEQVISPGFLSCDATIDPYDSFFAPLTDPLGGMSRGGPEIHIYRNVCIP